MNADRRGLFAALACALAVMALLGLMRSSLAIAYLNVRFTEQVDPLSKAVSYYVFVQEEAFTGALVAVAIATATVFVGMVQLRVRIGVPAGLLIAVWCAALVLCAYFPTDNSPRIETAHGLVHQIAGITLFASFPLAGMALAKTLRTQTHWARTARTVRTFSWVAAGLALTYLLARLPDLLPWPGFPLDGRAISGLVQRTLFALEVGLVGVLGWRLFHISWRTTRREVPA